MDIRKIIKKILREGYKNKIYDDDKNINWDLIDVTGGKVKCYHYSGENLDDFISIKGTSNLYSNQEYRSWGRSRAFFYLTKNGVDYDTGPPSNLYLYVSYIPLEQIYDINKNHNDYSFSSLEEAYQKTSEGGYNSWVYNWGKNPNVPILVSFVNVKISEKYYKGKRIF